MNNDEMYFLLFFNRLYSIEENHQIAIIGNLMQPSGSNVSQYKILIRNIM